MKLHFLTKTKSKQEQDPKLFHKNLFPNLCETESENESSNEYENEDLINDKSYFNSKFQKLNKLSMPLTDTIAEFVHEISEDKFFLDDISFIFEMSRKHTISPYAVIVALLYLKRLKENKDFNENSSSPSFLDKKATNFLSNTELFLITILLASKYLVDEGELEEIYNSEWAEVADLSTEKINDLEKKILRQIDWKLHVSTDEFWNFHDELTEKITRKKVKMQYNQCTYTDLEFLLRSSIGFSSEIIKNHLNFISKVMFICSSALVYLAVSSVVLSAFVFYVKNEIGKIGYSNQYSNRIDVNETKPIVTFVDWKVNLIKIQKENTSNENFHLKNYNQVKNCYFQMQRFDEIIDENVFEKRNEEYEKINSINNFLHNRPVDFFSHH